MHLPDPTFPPLLKGYSVSAPGDPVSAALDRVKSGDAGAGDIYWAKNYDTMQFAMVLEPEVPRKTCFQMLYLGMVAFSDALGALAPPEVPVTFLWPSAILVNGAIAGSVSLEIDHCPRDDIPKWMVFSISVSLRPVESEIEPGQSLGETSLFMEGCGDLDRTMLIESTARHMVNWIYTWSEEGFAPVHREWIGRYHDDEKLGRLADEVRCYENLSGNWLGMDESGDALVKSAGGSTVIIETEQALRD